MNSPNDLISVEEARHILRETQEPPHDPERDCWTDPAMANMARTVITQAEQIDEMRHQWKLKHATDLAKDAQIKRLQAFSSVLMSKLGIYGFADEVTGSLDLLREGDLGKGK